MKNILLCLFISICLFINKSNAQNTIIPTNAVWKYLSNGSNQGTNWRNSSFDDSSWPQGAAELGYGDAPTTTVTANKTTYYFRKNISITPSQFSDFTLKLRRDDGIVVYVNGTEVYRNNMPSGTISYTTQASSACSDDGKTIFTNTISNSLFISGTNTIAAEVHNSSTSSSDITFELQLIGNSISTSSCAVPNVGLFTTTNKTATSAQVGWSSVAGALSYNVQYRIRNVGASYSVAISTNNNYLILNNLTPSTNYEFIVQTICSGGQSAYSSSGWFTTNSSSTTCSIPSSLSVSNLTNTSAVLNWLNVSEAQSYNINYRSVGSSTWTTTTSTTNSKNITGLVVGTNYEFCVQTVCSAGNSSFSPTSSFTTTGGISSSSVPQFTHIVVVIGENTNASSVIGNTTDAPYINSLAQAGAYFTNSYAITHPSQPNYLQLFSGSNQGVTNDSKPASHFTTPNLAKELINAGKTFIYYNEGLPSVGYDGTSSGLYQRKHNALANWMGTGTNQVPTTLNQPFTSFPTNFNNLPSVSFVVPDMCNDGHDVCFPYNNRTKQYDAWIQNNLDAYKQYCSNPANNSLLIVTYDEDDFTSTNKISTVFYGSKVLVGSYSQTINHYNVLRTLEDANGLTTHAGAAASSTPINFCWSSVAKINNETNESKFTTSLYPNPTNGNFKLEFNDAMNKNVAVQIFNLLGENKLNWSFKVEDSFKQIELNKEELGMNPGIYIIRIIFDNNQQDYRLVVQ